jgi:hypothetical protein
MSGIAAACELYTKGFDVLVINFIPFLWIQCVGIPSELRLIYK